MFKTIFWAVPAFILVEPVTTSGPVTGVMLRSLYWAIGGFSLHAMLTVRIPDFWHIEVLPSHRAWFRWQQFLSIHPSLQSCVFLILRRRRFRRLLLPPPHQIQPPVLLKSSFGPTQKKRYRLGRILLHPKSQHSGTSRPTVKQPSSILQSHINLFYCICIFVESEFSASDLPCDLPVYDLHNLYGGQSVNILCIRIPPFRTSYFH